MKAHISRIYPLKSQTFTDADLERLRGQPLHPFCNVCGWRKGGLDSWDGHACKCGLSAPAIKRVEQ